MKSRRRLYWEVMTQPVMKRMMPRVPQKPVMARRNTLAVSSVVLSSSSLEVFFSALSSIEDFFS